MSHRYVQNLHYPRNMVVEQGLGRSIISPEKASDYIRSIEDGEVKELPNKPKKKE